MSAKGTSLTVAGYALPILTLYGAHKWGAKTSTKFLLTGASLPFAYALRIAGSYETISNNLIWSYTKPKFSRDGLNVVITLPTKIENKNKFGDSFTSIRGNVFLGRGEGRKDLGAVTIAAFKLEKEKTASFDVVLKMRFTQIADNVMQVVQDGFGMDNIYFDARYNFENGISFKANIPLLT